MKAYIIRSETKIAPFEEHVQHCQIGNETLEALRYFILQYLGIETVYINHVSEIDDFEEYIVLGDNIYFSPELLSEFIAKSRRAATHVCICALKRGVVTLRTAASVQNVKILSSCVEYNLRYYPIKQLREGSPRTIVINPDELAVSLPMPEHMCGEVGYPIPVTNKFVIQIDHWVNLWMANIITVLAYGVRLQKSPKWKLLLLALKARSFNKWKISAIASRIGRNCDIHPTAYVEGSVVRDGVTLGAGAVVRNSLVGNGAYIGNSVVVEQSVIGDNCTILNGRVLFSVLGRRCFSVADMITASYLGRECFLGLNSTQTDFRFDDRNVAVVKNGELVDSGNRFLGACLGHGVYLGSGSVVAPGRTIPCGVRIAIGEDRIVRRCESGQAEIDGFRIVNK